MRLRRAPQPPQLVFCAPYGGSESLKIKGKGVEGEQSPSGWALMAFYGALDSLKSMKRGWRGSKPPPGGLWWRFGGLRKPKKIISEWQKLR